MIPNTPQAAERFLGDEALQRGWKVPVVAAPTGKRVLVVGAGPSGLPAATSPAWVAR
jgi:NADPH-dependent glutamate synthase beta subunit-like oxidoreductase